MAGFDPTLDKELFKEAVKVGTFELSAAVMSYNEGMPKVQIGRSRVNKDGELGFAKLGRMTLEEIQAVMPLVQKAKEFMEEQAMNPDNASE